MRLTRFEDVPYKERLPRHRDGMLEYRMLATGTEGTSGNYAFQCSRTSGDFFSPRHRHNFDQYRIQREGIVDFGRHGKMTPGTIGYFPEGTFYGPQSQAGQSVTLVLQFGSASGNGFLSREEVAAGSRELAQLGSFNKGVFTRLDDKGRKRNKDGYEAIWEHFHHRPIAYPKQRYRDPLLINPDSFDFVPSKTEPGVAWKQLGSFGERITSIGFVRVDAGAALMLPDNALYFAMAGRGRVGEVAWGAEATLALGGSGENVRLVAEAPSELLYMTLPDLSDLALPAELAKAS